jgi:hypothetical protein
MNQSEVVACFVYYFSSSPEKTEETLIESQLGGIQISRCRSQNRLGSFSS